MCQQSLEKCFKALLTFQDKEILLIHNLRRLAEMARKGLIYELPKEKGSVMHGRNYIGIELNPAYVELSQKRINGVQMEAAL